MTGFWPAASKYSAKNAVYSSGSGSSNCAPSPNNANRLKLNPSASGRSISARGRTCRRLARVRVNITMAGISKRRKVSRKRQDPLKIAGSPDLVIMLLKPFQAYLIILRLTDGEQFLQLLLGHRVSQHHAAKP